MASAGSSHQGSTLRGVTATKAQACRRAAAPAPSLQALIAATRRRLFAAGSGRGQGLGARQISRQMLPAGFDHTIAFKLGKGTATVSMVRPRKSAISWRLIGSATVLTAPGLSQSIAPANQKGRDFFLADRRPSRTCVLSWLSSRTANSFMRRRRCGLSSINARRKFWRTGRPQPLRSRRRRSCDVRTSSCQEIARQCKSHDLPTAIGSSL